MSGSSLPGPASRLSWPRPTSPTTSCGSSARRCCWRSACRPGGRRYVVAGTDVPTRSTSPSCPQPGCASPAAGARTRWGCITNLANPKAAVFVFAFYPQFLPKGYPLLPTAAGLGLLQVTVETAFYLGIAVLVSRAGAWFARSRVRRGLDVVSGTVLVGLGLRVATEAR